MIKFTSLSVMSARLAALAMLATFSGTAAAQIYTSVDSWLGNPTIPSGLKAKTIDGGFTDFAVIDPDGTLHLFGQMASVVGRNPLPGRFKDVSVGYNALATLSEDGFIEVLEPYNAGPITWNRPLDGGYKEVSVGTGAISAIRSDGTLTSWGYDELATVFDSPNGTFRSVCQSYVGAYGIRTDGSIVEWGDTAYGSRFHPTGNDYVSIIGNDFYENVFAIRQDGSIQIVSAEDFDLIFVPEELTNPLHPNFVRVKDIAVGAAYCQALLENGKIVTWGTNWGFSGEPSLSVLYPDVTFGIVDAAGLSFIGSEGVFNPTLGFQLGKATFEQKEKGVATLSLSPALLSDLVLTVNAGAGINAPSTVTIPAGSTSADLLFSVAPNAAVGQASISVSGTGYSETVSFDVVPATQKVAAISVPKSAVGNSDVEIEVFMNLWSRTPLTVNLSTTNPALNVPATVTIPARSNRVAFRIGANDVLSVVNGELTASFESSSVSKPIEIRPNRMTGFVLSSGSASVGQTVTGTVTFAAPVAQDTLVSIAASRPGAAPTTVTVPAGSATGTFSLTLTQAHKGRNLKVTVTRNGASRIQYVYVNP